MTRTGAIAFGIALAAATMPAYAQESSPALSSTFHAVPAPSYYPDTVELNNRQSVTPLFKLGGFDAGVWAPVEQPYNTQADRNLAADPIWQAG